MHEVAAHCSPCATGVLALACPGALLLPLAAAGHGRKASNSFCAAVWQATVLCSSALLYRDLNWLEINSRLVLAHPMASPAQHKLGEGVMYESRPELENYLD